MVSTVPAAYSQGGGTYTGIEAVSNNVNMLAEPRVRTGKWTMFYMALSLRFTAGGIILLYLLWDAAQIAGADAQRGGVQVDYRAPRSRRRARQRRAACWWCWRSKQGFCSSPPIPAFWAAGGALQHGGGLVGAAPVPALSSRLVTQNGILLMGAAALAVLVWTNGSVGLLVVLYSINVFLTFSLSLFGLHVFRWRHRRDEEQVHRRLLLAGSPCGNRLDPAVLVVERFGRAAG